ncbi:MAG: hypothetical protein IT513_14900 [Burkholderiales bacterium]|nr:hypothetical protein [Burkholderiales bacterium]
MSRFAAGFYSIVVMSFLVFGCSSDTAEWQEEVKLYDGRVVTVMQKRRYESAYAGGSVHLSQIVREAWIKVKLAETGNKEIEWHENLIPRRLDAWKGNLVIVGDPPTSLEYDKYGKQEPIQIALKYKDGSWQRMKFEEIPREIYDTNLVVKHRLPAGMTFLTLVEKESRQFNGDPYLSKESMTIVPMRSNFYREKN